MQGDAPKPIPFYTVMTVDTAMASHASPAVFRQFGPVKTAGRRKDQAEIIHEKVLCIGAKDDVLWVHFAFPESMLKIMLSGGGSLLVGLPSRRTQISERMQGNTPGY